MFEHQQQKSNEVSMDEYVAARRYRASADELVKPPSDPDQDSSRGQFILRLLDPDHSGAFDRLVKVVGRDDVSSPDQAASFLVSVRPVDGANTRAEPYTIDGDNIIIVNSINENGYFLDATGIDPDEFRNVSRVELVPKEAVELKVLALPLPTEENY